MSLDLSTLTAYAVAHSEPIGDLTVDRIACDTTRHVLTCGNPWMDLTFCQCGTVRVPGQHTTVHERFVYDSATQGARLLGYDQYRLWFCACHPDGLVTA